jgi:hypothetical protein
MGWWQWFAIGASFGAVGYMLVLWAWPKINKW